MVSVSGLSPIDYFGFVKPPKCQNEEKIIIILKKIKNPKIISTRVGPLFPTAGNYDRNKNI
jgi:hypothetical protein